MPLRLCGDEYHAQQWERKKKAESTRARRGALSYSNVSSAHFSSVTQLCPTLCDPMDCSTPPCPSPAPRVYPNSCPLCQWCQPTIWSSVIPFSSCLHLSQHQGLFKWVSSLHQMAKVKELQLQHQSFNEYSELISFRINWFDLLAVQGILKSFL